MYRILESDCDFYPNNASPGSIIRGDGDLVIHSSQLGIDSRFSHNDCILPHAVEVQFDSGEVRPFEGVGSVYHIDEQAGVREFQHWLYYDHDRSHISLHILHG